MTGLESIPWWGVLTLVLLSLVQMGLLVWGVIALLQTPDDRLRLIPNRWVWLAVILLISGVGAIVFLAAGRKPATVDVVSVPAGGDLVHRAVAVLYGEGPAHPVDPPPGQPAGAVPAHANEPPSDHALPARALAVEPQSAVATNPAPRRAVGTP